MTEESTARNTLCEVDILIISPPPEDWGCLGTTARLLSLLTWSRFKPGKLSQQNPQPMRNTGYASSILRSYRCGSAIATFACGSMCWRTSASTSPHRRGSHSLCACPGVIRRSYQDKVF